MRKLSYARLISTFIFCCLDSIMPIVSISEISRLYPASVAEKAGLCLTWSQTTEDRYSHAYHLSRPMTKPTKWHVRPATTQISLGIRSVWSESSLSAWRKFGSLATHWAHSEDSDQTGRMPRLIWVFAGRTLILFVLSCRGSKRDDQEVAQ